MKQIRRAALLPASFGPASMMMLGSTGTIGTQFHAETRELWICGGICRGRRQKAAWQAAAGRGPAPHFHAGAVFIGKEVTYCGFGSP